MPGRFETWWYSTVPWAARTLALPDFLGIGAQKAGTTWLYENLRHHPEVFVTEKKELHYFDKRSAFERPLREYARHFEKGRGRIKGEITPRYSLLPVERIRFIRSIRPDLRLIFMMRNPVDRAWSQLSMHMKKRGRTLADVTETEIMAHLESHGVVGRSDYPSILDRWLSIFPREQLFIGFFEEIREQPRKLLVRIFDHIGVSRNVTWESFPLTDVIVPERNSGQPERRRGEPFGPCPDAVRNRLYERYAGEFKLLAERYGAPIECWRERGE